MRRRTYLATATATGVALAGCAELGWSGSNTEPDERTTDTPPPLEGPDDTGTIDDFSDFSAWSVVAGRASLVDEEASVGERSLPL